MQKDKNADDTPDSSNHKQSKIQRIKNNFIKNLPTKGLEISKALDTQDWDELDKLVHTLKGVSGNLGFEKIMNSIIEVENEMQHADKEVLKIK